MPPSVIPVGGHPALRGRVLAGYSAPDDIVNRFTKRPDPRQGDVSAGRPGVESTLRMRAVR